MRRGIGGCSKDVRCRNVGADMRRKTVAPDAEGVGSSYRRAADAFADRSGRRRHTLRMANCFRSRSRRALRILAQLATTIGGVRARFRGTTSPRAVGHRSREPFGVTAAITPWNFPFILMMWKAGPPRHWPRGTDRHKPATYTPLSTLEFARILQETDFFPPGVINVVPGAAQPRRGARIERWSTGRLHRFDGGRPSHHAARLGHGEKVTLELGGKSAKFLLDDADLDIAIPGSLWATFLHSGQICHSGTRLFVRVDPRRGDRAPRRYGEGLKIGSGPRLRNRHGAVIHRSQNETVER